MNAAEILGAMAKAEGLYVEVGHWAVARHDEHDEEGREFAATKYSGMGYNQTTKTALFYTFEAALTYALQDGKP